MSKKKVNATEQGYVVCCEPRIVLFGYATPAEIQKESPTLRRTRMAVYYSADTHGVLGLASKGPGPQCRISPAVDEHTIRTKVECVCKCTPEAVEKWEAEPWG